MLDRSLTATTSAPCDANLLADSLETSRVTARTAHVLFSLGSLRNVFTMAPPWLPVAPTTVMILLADIFVDDLFPSFSVE